MRCCASCSRCHPTRRRSRRYHHHPHTQQPAVCFGPHPPSSLDAPGGWRVMGSGGVAGRQSMECCYHVAVTPALPRHSLSHCDECMCPCCLPSTCCKRSSTGWRPRCRPETSPSCACWPPASGKKHASMAPPPPQGESATVGIRRLNMGLVALASLFMVG